MFVQMDKLRALDQKPNSLQVPLLWKTIDLVGRRQPWYFWLVGQVYGNNMKQDINFSANLRSGATVG